MEAFRVLEFDDSVTDVLYGGSKGGGKSVFLCFWAYYKAIQLADQLNLQPGLVVPHVGWIGRKVGSDFTATTLQTWTAMSDMIPPETYEIRTGTERTPRHILIDGRVAIDYGGLDNQRERSKFNSAEYIFICVDQAEETTRDDISTLRASRRMRIAGQHFRYKGLFTANPSPGWLRDEFITNPRAGCKFVQALPGDNPFLPSDYIETLRRSYEYRPELLQAYLYGSWSSLESPNQMIHSDWVESARKRSIFRRGVGGEFEKAEHRCYVSCDPARYGDDETVIYVLADGEIVETVIMGYCSTTQISNAIFRLSRAYGTCPAVVESVGADVGAGVVDELRDMGVEVLAYNPAKRLSTEHFNLRAEAWDTASKIFCRGDFGAESNVVFSCRDIDTQLEAQLCSVTYKYRNGKLMVESKEDLKRKLGRSPDRADAYVAGLWAWSKMQSLRRLGDRRADYKRLSEQYRSPWAV